MMNEQLSVSHESSVCPFHDMRTTSGLLKQDDELLLPKHKRIVAQYMTDKEGLTELHLHYGDMEITFDEPELFAFGESLAKQARFAAGDAMLWGDGYGWLQVQELLEQLLEEGVLVRAAAQTGTGDFVSGIRPSRLPPAESTQARHWFDFADIMRDLTGQSLELGYLELVIPIFRVAHIALDAEGRQVGEANVFPTQLRLEVPTEWRACTYAGSRYQDDFPMNITALHSMSKYWDQMMSALLQVRKTYLRRFPKADGAWTVGHLQRLAILVLSIPAYQLMRGGPALFNGAMHPVLSCMFRVTDGVRMVTDQMLYVSLDEAALPPDAQMTGMELYAYAERNNMFHSAYGVCAGPKTMITEFLSVLIDGWEPPGITTVVQEDAVQRALAELDQAFDYCLLGLQAYAVTFSLWPTMGHAYEKLLAVLDAWEEQDRTEKLTKFRERISQSVSRLHEVSGPADEWVAARGPVYADMYRQAANGLGAKSPSSTLAEAIAPIYLPEHRQAAKELQRLVAERLDLAGSVLNQQLETLTDSLVEYFRQEQATVRACTEIQLRVNALLGRMPPKQLLKAADLYLFYKLQTIRIRQPYLIADVEEMLGISICVTSESMAISAA